MVSEVASDGKLPPSTMHPEPLTSRNRSRGHSGKVNFSSTNLHLAEDGERQVSTLLYCMGEASEDILNMSGITDENQKVVIGKFDAHFKVQMNLIFE